MQERSDDSLGVHADVDENRGDAERMDEEGVSRARSCSPWSRRAQSAADSIFSRPRERTDSRSVKYVRSSATSLAATSAGISPRSTSATADHLRDDVEQADGDYPAASAGEVLLHVDRVKPRPGP